MIQIVQFPGIDSQLYKLVAPLVMDPEVLRKNNNYPFKTTKDFVWFIALRNKRVVGFMPVEKRNKSGVINNYYVEEEEKEKEKGEGVLHQLLSEVVAVLGTEYALLSVTLVEHQSLFQQMGFGVEKEWKRYVKMRR